MEHTPQSSDPIKMQSHMKAVTLFEMFFIKNMKGGSIQQFKKDYPTLHDKVIIPMAQALIMDAFMASKHRDELEVKYEASIKEMKRILNAIESGSEDGDMYTQRIGKGYITYIRSKLNIN